jgi:hypothetical protein
MRWAMKPRRIKIVAKAAVCALLLTAATRPVVANSLPTKTDVVWIGVGIVAIGAGIGIGVYYAFHHNQSLTGCAVSGANGLEFENNGNKQKYLLVGAVDSIKPGERIRVSGKNVKSAGGIPQFRVDRLSKDFGPCPSNP